MVQTFKQKPKEGDIEVRMVLALNTTDPNTQEMIKRINARPKMERVETRTFTNNKWLDWKEQKT